MGRSLRSIAFGLAVVLLMVARAGADDYQTSGTRPLESLSQSLPAPVSDGLDLEGWLWVSDLQNNFHPPANAYDAELSLAVTKSFDQRVALTAQGNFIDADGVWRAELEQGYLSMRLYDPTRTLLTVGKFNANFGVEGRDFWERQTGTTSLLFGAQPQDLIGVMVTQPLWDSGVTLRPFLSADFQGAYNFDQPPGGGLMIDYQVNRELNLGLTNWVGPGMVMHGGETLQSPYPKDGYGDDGSAVVENWQGPNLYAERGGTLYFTEAKATWRPRPDLMLAAEYLLGTTGTQRGQLGWHGWLVLADYRVTDRMHVFGRYSALDDSNWLITGIFQKAQEVSGGFGYEIHDGVEVRAEYRHDFSNVTPDFDTVSVHLTMTF